MAKTRAPADPAYRCPICLRPPPPARITRKGKPIGRPPLYCREHARLAADLERVRVGLAEVGPHLSKAAQRALRGELAAMANYAFNERSEK